MSHDSVEQTRRLLENHRLRNEPASVVRSEGEKRKRPQRTASASRYIFRRFDAVFDKATLQSLRQQYATAERVVAEYGQRTLADGSYVYRQGRYDVALAIPRRQVSEFALTSMNNGGVDARLRTGTRALVVPRATAAQPWHADRRTPERLPRYATLIVALEDMPEDGDGATEFRLPSSFDDGDGIISVTADGSFFDPDDDTLPVVRPRLLANQGILFDGRIVHRGGAATRRRPPAVYTVFTEATLEENV